MQKANENRLDPTTAAEVMRANGHSSDLAVKATKPTRKEARERQTAEPIKVILSRETGDVVGWLYKWNTGALVPMWKNGKQHDVIYE